MSETHLENIERAVDTAHVWLRDIAEELGTQDRRRAWHALGAVLAVLRDRLPIDEAAQLSAQLPLLVRGLFYEGWDPAPPSALHTRGDFLHAVQERLDHVTPVDAADACSAVFATLRRHVSAGEMEDVRSVLPTEIKALVAGQVPAGVA